MDGRPLRGIGATVGKEAFDGIAISIPDMSELILRMNLL